MSHSSTTFSGSLPPCAPFLRPTAVPVWHSKTYIKVRVGYSKGQISQRFAPTQFNRLSIPHNLRAPQLPNTTSFALQSPTNPATKDQHRPTADCHAHLPHIPLTSSTTSCAWTTVERTIFPSEHQSLSSRPRLMAHFQARGQSQGGRGSLIGCVLDMVVGRCSSSCLSRPLGYWMGCFIVEMR